MQQGRSVMARDTPVPISPRPTSGVIQLPIQWVTGVRRPEREADHLSPSSTDVKCTWN
jgi:hypothetical protein